MALAQAAPAAPAVNTATGEIMEDEELGAPVDTGSRRSPCPRAPHTSDAGDMSDNERQEIPAQTEQPAGPQTTGQTAEPQAADETQGVRRWRRPRCPKPPSPSW